MDKIQGKKQYPNGYYLGNVWLADKKGKCVVVGVSDDPMFDYIAFSNSSRVKDDPTWKPLEGKKGWFYKNFKSKDITIF